MKRSEYQTSLLNLWLFWGVFAFISLGTAELTGNASYLFLVPEHEMGYCEQRKVIFLKISFPTSLVTNNITSDHTGHKTATWDVTYLWNCGTLTPCWTERQAYGAETYSYNTVTIQSAKTLSFLLFFLAKNLSLLIIILLYLLKWTLIALPALEHSLLVMLSPSLACSTVWESLH